MGIPAFAALSASTPLAPFSIHRRAPGPHDVQIEIRYCGVCHSDIHFVHDDWGRAVYPMVPGHEIVGEVSAVGADVRQWAVGDRVGVGCFVDSCRHCDACRRGEEQFCEEGMSATYNGFERTDGVLDKSRPTYGGYSTRIVVDENYVLRIPEGMDAARAAPLLCAGITTYSPLRRFGVGCGTRVGVIGLGGLGHVGVKIARALGAHVSVISHSPDKREGALALGADQFVCTRDAAAFEQHAGAFDVLLDTVSAVHDYNAYLRLLRCGGTMVLVGLPGPAPVRGDVLVHGRLALAGSMIGGIRETQEMLDFCGEHGIVADIELIPIQDINRAYERVIAGDVHYRFVIDIASLRAA